ncbi:MAG TPA: hypothetical protein ENJ56_06410 [Anaerolineae bacterium]|nr:hypothetical protein [Anaerolineae bacterium]
MFDGKKNRKRSKNGKSSRSRLRQERPYEAVAPDEQDFGRYDNATAYQDHFRQSAARHTQSPAMEQFAGYTPDGLEPTMLPESRQDRRQRNTPRHDGTTRDRAIRELPPNMPDFGDTPKPSSRAKGRGNRPQYDEVIGAPASPHTRPPEPQYDEVIGAPPPQREPVRSNKPRMRQAPPPQRPRRPQIESRRPEQPYRSNGNGRNNGHESVSPNFRRADQRPQVQSDPMQFGGGSAETPYSDNGYATYEVTKKGRKKGRRRRKKEKVQLPDQKSDVGEPIELRDATSRLLMRFDAGIVDNLRHMTTRLTATTGEIPSRIALVSSLPGEGTTFVSRALATVMAHDMSARIAYVDLNWWSQGTPIFATPDNQGLVSVVTGEKRLDEIFVSTTIPNLTLIPGGQLERGDRPIMARSNVLKSAIDVLDHHFDYLVFDIPAIRATNDSIPLAKLAKGIVMVIKQGETPNDTVRQALDEVKHLNMLGIMLNQVKYKTPNFIRRIIPQD